MTTKETTGIHRSTLIDAPVERAFAYYSEPENLPEIWPSLIEVKDVTYAPEGWPQRFRWVYKMAGMKFEGNCEHVVFEKNSRIVGHNKGGIESTIEVTFGDEDGKTRVTMESQTRVPIPLLGKVAEKFLAKSNENEADTILANLKARLESDVP